MKQWLAEYWVGSVISTVPGTHLSHTHPDGIYAISIRDAQKEFDEDCALVAQITFSSSTLSEAADYANAEIRKFVRLMSFVCNAEFRLLRRVGIIEADNMISMREAFVDAVTGALPPEPSLAPEHLETIHFFQSCGSSTLLERALRWYTRGISSKFMEDQFQFFWFAIELIALSKKLSEKVSDKCQKCRSDLYCATFDEVSTHRPFGKQLIEELIISISQAREIYEVFLDIRNQLMHGEPVEEIESRLAAKIPDFSFEGAVNKIANVAWKAILREFKIPEGIHRPAILVPATFVYKELIGHAHMTLGVQFDQKDASSVCRPLADIKVKLDDVS